MHKAYAKKDRVNMQRSLSEPMFNYATQLRNSKRANPFLKQVNTFKVLQSRMHADNDHLLPEDQWAQITVLLTGTLANKAQEPVDMYTVYERRVADKLDYFDWKISFMALEEDFRILNDIKI